MGVLKINCHCDETLMEDAIALVANRLEQVDIREIGDIDEEIGDIRICVDFNIYMDTVKLEAAEILDNDWDLLYEDTAVFTSRLRPVIALYNQTRQSELTQSTAIRCDNMREMGIY